MNSKSKLIDINTKKSYIWNTIAGMLNSFHLFILLLIIPRTNGQVAAGIVSGAFAIGNLVMTIGKYGMRSFQVSDVAKKYSERTYYVSRVITNFVMLASFMIYGFVLFAQGTYSIEKLLVLFMVCFLKLLDAYEDIFHGMLQRAECFDIASRAMAIRLFCTIVTQIVCLFTTKNILITFLISIVVSAVLLWVLTIKPTIGYWGRKKSNGTEVVNLLKECLPLGVWMFISMYMGNYPKYAIDAYLSDEVQATFNYIFMPVFVINLLNSFIFQPLLTKVSQYWQDGRLKEFKKVIYIQFGLIIGITVVTMFLGYICGIQILEYVFACELEQYMIEFLLLLACGGLLAITTLLAMVLTIMRKQILILLLHVIGAFTAFVMQKTIITNYDIMGIILLYVAILMFLVITLGIAVLSNTRKQVKEIE